ncbi:uncharacterized protein LOC117212311 [Bombus bifarius]|uniref:Uncharacterized protein LOC117212311 n=1 Tax=Bombus bifarius TaxID=103933 RepID=A0A6P8MGG1_9HYME|nr:uncharacterized protein LOC117212311 [Bombus bifarius]
MSFHQFNAFTGRLKHSTQLQALYPLSPRPLEKVEPIKMMFDSVKTKPVSTSLSGKQNYSTVPAKLKKLQQEWQADLTKPTYLLRGRSDNMIVAGLSAVSAICFVANMYYLLELRKKF